MTKGWVFDSENEAQKHCDKLHEILQKVEGYDAVQYGFPVKHHAEERWFVQYVEQYSINLPEWTDEIDKEAWFPEDKDVEEFIENQLNEMSGMNKRSATISNNESPSAKPSGSSVREPWYKRLLNWFKRILKL